METSTTVSTGAPASAPPSPAPASTPSTEAAPSPSQASTTPNSSPTTEGAPETTAPATTPADEIRQRLQGLTPQEILDLDPRLAGKIGELAQKQAQREAQRLAREMAQAEVSRQTAEAARRAEVERLKTLRRTDPFAYANEEERLEAEAEQRALQQHHENRLVQSIWNDFDAIIHAYHSTLPPQVQRQLSGKEYPGNAREARQAYLAEAAQLTAELKANEALNTEVDKRLAARSSEQEQALRNRLLAELNGGEPTTIGGAGVPTPSDAVSPAEWAAHKGDRSWRKANMPRINTALQRGVPLAP